MHDQKDQKNASYFHTFKPVLVSYDFASENQFQNDTLISN